MAETDRAPLRVTVPAIPEWLKDNPLNVPDTAAVKAPAWLKEEEPPQVGQLEAGLRGVGSGATFGWLDELIGALGAGQKLGVQDMSVSPQEPEAGVNPADIYREMRDIQRTRNEAARAQNPWTYGVGEFAGGAAVPLPGAGLMGAGRSLAVRAGGAALQGGLTGALSGAGEAKTMGEVLGAAATGAGVGAAVGAPLGMVMPTISHYLLNPVRSFFRPQTQADRLMAETAVRAGFNRQGPPTRAMHERQLSPTEPVPPETMLADYLGAPGYQLTRWAKNVSPEAAQILEPEVQARARGAFQRMRDMFERRYGISDNEIDRLRLRAEAARTNNPLYQIAMLHGARGVDSAELLAIEQAPAVQQAIQGVTASLQNRAIGQRQGFSANAARDSLVYWDQVKRGLDRQVGLAQRAGDRETVSELTPLTQRLVAELDRLVPEYAAARGNAAMYFGRTNAIEAGQEFITSKSITTARAEAALRLMQPAEREAFRRAAINEFINQTSAITGQGTLTGRTSSFWDKINNSPKARGKLELIMGDAGLRELEAMQRIGVIQQWTQRAAMSGSSTAQNFATMALMGTAGGYGYGSDLSSFGMGAGVGAFAGHLLSGLSRSGRAHINDQVAQRIATMLVSNDPQQLQRVIDIASRHDGVMRWIRDMSSAAVTRGSAREAVGQSNVPARTP